jgi:hypothetical protein
LGSRALRRECGIERVRMILDWDSEHGVP